MTNGPISRQHLDRVRSRQVCPFPVSYISEWRLRCRRLLCQEKMKKLKMALEVCSRCRLIYNYSSAIDATPQTNEITGERRRRPRKRCRKKRSGEHKPTPPQADSATSGSKSAPQVTPNLTLPWIRGGQVIERLKGQILRLSSDEQNFLRRPPLHTSSWFHWTPEKARQQRRVAMALQREDGKLAAMHTRLVPRKYVDKEQS